MTGFTTRSTRRRRPAAKIPLTHVAGRAATGLPTAGRERAKGDCHVSAGTTRRWLPGDGRCRREDVSAAQRWCRTSCRPPCRAAPAGDLPPGAPAGHLHDILPFREGVLPSMQRPELGKGSSIVALKVECDLEKQGEVGIVSAKYLPAIKCYNELTRALIRSAYGG